MTPKLEQLKMVAQARANGRTWDEIAALPAMPSRATLLRWQETSLIPDPAEVELRGTDVLLLLLTDPTTTQSVRAKAAADLERLRIAGAPDPTEQGSGTVQLVFSDRPSCTCAACTRQRAAACEATANAAFVNISFPGRPSMSAADHAEVLAEMNAAAVMDDEGNRASS